MFFITGNANKFQEAREFFPNLEMLDIDLPEIQGIDPQKLIEHKLQQASQARKGEDLIVDDTSLNLACLNGLPGPLVKWFLKAMGPEGLHAITANFGQPQAEAKATIGYLDSKGQTHFFEGTVKGEIVAPRGGRGFGFDKVFQPEGKDKTFAEMTLSEKNEISHRRQAFLKLQEFLNST